MTLKTNIIYSFYRRSLIALVFLGLLSSTTIYYYQQYLFYQEIAGNIKQHVSKELKKYQLQQASADELQHDVKQFMSQLGFISTRVYDAQKKQLFEYIIKEHIHINNITIFEQHYPSKMLDPMHKKILAHTLKNKDNLDYDYLKIDEHYFLKIYYIVYLQDKPFRYIEGIKLINPKVIKKFKQMIVIHLITVFISILTLSLILFPIIYFAYKQLKKNAQELIANHLLTIKTLGNAIALRDSDTNEHNYRVTLYAVYLAEKMHLDRVLIKQLIIGSFLHDIGKIGISDSILLKPGKLTQQEFELMKLHVLKGMEIISGNQWLEHGKDVVLFHHEKYNGLGYPQQLKGDNIPIIARVFSIIDVFDALTSSRPYKKAFSYEKSIEIIKKDAGLHFDENIVAIFSSVSQALCQDIQGKSAEQLRDDLKKIITNYFILN